MGMQQHDGPPICTRCRGVGEYSPDYGDTWFTCKPCGGSGFEGGEPLPDDFGDDYVDEIDELAVDEMLDRAQDDAANNWGEVTA